MNGTAMVMELTTFELKKLDVIQGACPKVDVQLVSRADSYLILGYKGETDEALIRVENSSLAQAERNFRSAYQRLVSAGWLSGGRRAIA